MAIDIPKVNYSGIGSKLGSTIGGGLMSLGQDIDEKTAQAALEKELQNFDASKQKLADEVADTMGGKYSQKQIESTKNYIIGIQDKNEFIEKGKAYYDQLQFFNQSGGKIKRLPLFGISLGEYEKLTQPEMEKAQEGERAKTVQSIGQEALAGKAETQEGMLATTEKGLAEAGKPPLTTPEAQSVGRMGADLPSRGELRKEEQFNAKQAYEEHSKQKEEAKRRDPSMATWYQQQQVELKQYDQILKERALNNTEIAELKKDRSNVSAELVELKKTKSDLNKPQFGGQIDYTAIAQNDDEIKRANDRLRELDEMMFIRQTGQLNKGANSGGTGGGGSTAEAITFDQSVLAEAAKLRAAGETDEEVIKAFMYRRQSEKGGVIGP